MRCRGCQTDRQDCVSSRSNVQSPNCVSVTGLRRLEALYETLWTRGFFLPRTLSSGKRASVVTHDSRLIGLPSATHERCGLQTNVFSFVNNRVERRQPMSLLHALRFFRSPRSLCGRRPNTTCSSSVSRRCRDAWDKQLRI